MRYKILNYSKKDKLIVFFAGALAHPSHYAHLKSNEFDVLFLYDFSDNCFDLDIKAFIYSYKKVFVIAHSMGVMLSCKLAIKACKKIAINGTGIGIDRLKGIHPRIFLKSIKGFDLNNFKALLFGKNLAMSSDFVFSKNPIKELNALYEIAINNKLELKHTLLKKSINLDLSKARFFTIPFTNMSCKGYWDKAISSNKDLVFPQNALINYFDKIIKINQPHFVFFAFNSWDEICLM